MTAEWTAENIAAAKRMFADGKGATEIGKTLGFSRSSVCGKLFRLGIARSGPRILRVGEGKSSPKPQVRLGPQKKLAPIKKKPMPEPTPVAVEPKNIPLTSCGLFDCRWPTAFMGEHLFCGHEGRPYCAAHAKVAGSGLVLKQIRVPA